MDCVLKFLLYVNKYLKLFFMGNCINVTTKKIIYKHIYIIYFLILFFYVIKYISESKLKSISRVKERSPRYHFNWCDCTVKNHTNSVHFMQDCFTQV